MNFQKIPKVELHLHLDGSVRLETVCQLLNKNMEEVKSKMIAKETCSSLSEYLTAFELPLSILQTKENLKLVAKQLAEDLVKDGVVYAEIRFCPLLHTKEGLAVHEVVDAVLDGLSEVSLKTNLILCMMRNFEISENEKIIAFAKQYLNHGVVAVDLAGDEEAYPTSEFLSLFEKVKEEGIPFTIHAGEVVGQSSIESAILFGTKRLGHGIQVIESNICEKEVLEKNVLLEICPTSNVQTKAVSSYEKHPIKRLYELGFHISINTDNRTVSNITLTKEYELLNHYFHFTLKDFEKINMDAINFSFLNESEKQEIKEKLKMM